MPLSARAYLLDRFRSDAVALRQRADALAAAPRSAKLSGPDADTSRQMSQACDSVVAMIEAVPEAEDAERALSNLLALVPLLEHHAAQEKGAAPVRAVYIGAATRIREVEAAEARAGRQLASVDDSGQHFDDDDPEIDDDDDASERV